MDRCVSVQLWCLDTLRLGSFVSKESYSSLFGYHTSPSPAFSTSATEPVTYEIMGKPNSELLDFRWRAIGKTVTPQRDFENYPILNRLFNNVTRWERKIPGEHNL